MEFLRFGSSIPGAYWGCCAADIIQNFKVDPDAKASIQLLEGDGGSVLTNKDGEAIFAGMTYKDIFLQRLRYGTFSTKDMPNHAFFAVLANSQLQTAVGKKWLAILHEQGFEFLRKVNNSVWNQVNYVFVLIRNCGANAVADQFTPPKEWTALGSPKVPEVWSFIPDTKAMTKEVMAAQKKLYAALPKNVFYTEKQLTEAGVPITLAGRRSEFPQELKATREQKEAAKKSSQPAHNPFPKAHAPKPQGCGVPATAAPVQPTLAVEAA